ncbi:MAG: DUF4340 domain-containing protein [Clostridia bacterium]|nr:DUF4340 domain-containing protein [Clostridia bacterium]
MSQEKDQNIELNEEINEAESVEQTETVPSIFDKPEIKEKKVRKRLPVWLTAVISVLLCAAIVVSAVYIPRLLEEDVADSSSTVSQAEVTITLTDYSKYNATMGEVEGYGKGGVKNIVYKVGGFDFELVQGEYEQVTTDAEGNEKKEKRVGWTIINHEGIRWSETNVSGLVQNALQVTAITKLAENVIDMSVYGLTEDKCFSTLTVNFKDESSYTVIVGNYSGDNTGRYIRFKDENTVYLSSFSFATYTSLNPEQMPALYGVGMYESNGKDSQYFSDGTLTFFDGIFLFGRKVPNPISFAQADTLSTYTYYTLVTPVEMAADDTAVQSVFSLLTTGVTASEVLEFMPDEKTVKEYGLSPKTDDNHLKIMYIVDGVTYQICIGNVLEDGNYPVMINSANVIYKVAPSVFTFIDYDYTDYMRKNLFLAGIVDMKSLSYKGEGLEETFHITNIAEDAENNVYKQTVKNSKGKAIDDKMFKEALATFQRLQATDYDDENFGKTDKKPTLTLTVKFLDEKRPDSVITFYEFSSRRYLYKIDGEGNALISIGDYENVVKAAKAAIDATI